MVIATDESAHPAAAAPQPADDSTAAAATNGGADSDEKKKWGYDLYPERKGAPYKPKWTSILFGMEGTENIDKIKCERNVVSCIKDSPMVKLMMGALKSSGWWVFFGSPMCMSLVVKYASPFHIPPFRSAVDIRRHISCEVCDVSVSGGYDPELNQVVVCQNIARSKGMVQGVLTHEMIHMFDYCNNDLDFKNVDHLACTEIRAANLTHCSFLSAWAQGDASPFKVRKAHEVSGSSTLPRIQEWEQIIFISLSLTPRTA